MARGDVLSVFLKGINDGKGAHKVLEGPFVGIDEVRAEGRALDVNLHLIAEFCHQGEDEKPRLGGDLGREILQLSITVL